MRQGPPSNEASPRRRRRPIGLSAVARQAGVAVSTASAILRGEPSCRAAQDTRQRVFDAARQLNYRPNQLARGLRSQGLNFIGTIINKLQGPSITIAKFAKVEQMAAEYGYRVWFSSHGGQPQRLREAVLELVDHRVAGVILEANWQSVDVLRELADMRMPTVALGAIYHEGIVPFVDVDRAHGAYLATRHLLEDVGARRLAFLAPQPDFGPGLEKIRGCERALAEVGSCMAEHLLYQGPAWLPGENELDRGRRMAKWLLDQDQPVDAVFSYADTAAMAMLQVFSEAGLRVPQDLALTGFDDIPFAQYANPPLTTVRQPLEVGDRAVELLMQQIQAAKSPDRASLDQSSESPEHAAKAPQSHVLLKPELVIRGSTLPSPASARSAATQSSQAART